MQKAPLHRWLFVEGLPALICAALTIMAARYRMSAGSPLYGNPGYAMTFTLTQFLGHSRKLMGGLVYAQEPGLTMLQTLALWAAAIAAAAVARKKYLWFFLWFALIAPLPVIFIPYRGFFVMYLPLAGWAMFAASLLVGGRNWLWSHVWKRPTLSSNAFEPERIVLFLMVAYFVWSVPRHDSASELGRIDPAQQIVRDTRRDIVRLNEPLPKGAKVIFLHDRFPADAWGPLMMSRQLYRDRTISVDRPTMMNHPPNLGDYDRVFDYVDGKFAVVGARSSEGGESAMLRRPR